MRVVVLCGGIGSRMKDYSLPKPLNMIYGKPSIYYTLKNLPDEQKELYFIYGSHLKAYNFEEIIINLFKTKVCTFYCIEYLTRGPVETAYVGTSFLDNSNESIVFLDNDNIYNFPDNFFENKSYNFLGTSIDISGTSAYSFINHKNNIVSNIVEKERISNTYCCGVYGFKNLEEFREISKKILTSSEINRTNEIYMSDVYRSLLDEKKEIRNIEFTNQGNHIGSLNELESSLKNIDNPKMRICFDLDNTLVTYPIIPGDYSSVKPIENTIELLRKLHKDGNTIIIHTARRMHTHKHNIGAVIKDIGRVTFDTLDNFNIPYDEIIFGKPIADVYIDDRAVNPYKEDYSFMGIFDYKIKETIINKLPTNKYNSIELVNNKIVKHGPIKIKDEYYVYDILKKLPSVSKFFPTCFDFFENNGSCTLTLEYIKGVPLYYLFKQNLLTKRILLHVLNIVDQIHNVVLDINVTTNQIKNNYVKKLEERYAKTEDYPFENSTEIQTKIIENLKKYTNSERLKIVNFIHGDLWFSNILYTFDRQIRCFDMRGNIDGILTTNGDPLYDYAKLYQSILGFDSILYGDLLIDNEYRSEICSFFENEVEKRGILLDDLKIVTISLISGTIHAIESYETKKNVWKFLTEMF